ncbi:MAG: hypothetical protein ACC655_03205 [Rhodothermia bacterium]
MAWTLIEEPNREAARVGLELESMSPNRGEPTRRSRVLLATSTVAIAVALVTGSSVETTPQVRLLRVRPEQLAGSFSGSHRNEKSDFPSWFRGFKPLRERIENNIQFSVIAVIKISPSSIAVNDQPFSSLTDALVNARDSAYSAFFDHFPDEVFIVVQPSPDAPYGPFFELLAQVYGLAHDLDVPQENVLIGSPQRQEGCILSAF